MAKTRQQPTAVKIETRRSTRCRKTNIQPTDEPIITDESEDEASGFRQKRGGRQNTGGGSSRILQFMDTQITKAIYACDPLTAGANHHVLGEQVEIRLEEPPLGHRTRSFCNGYRNGHLLADTGSVRRSTRQRKSIHTNLNQSWLLATGVSDFSKLYGDKHHQFVVEEDADSSNPTPVEDKDDPRQKDRNNFQECLDDSTRDFDDMYSRVKRVRRKTNFFQMTRDPGHMADTEDTDNNTVSTGDEGQTDIEADGSQEEEEEEVEEEVMNGVSTRHTKYSLRPKKPITDRYQYPHESSKPKINLFHSPHRSRLRSPYHTRKRRATRNSSSTSSSSSDDGFDKRKSRSKITKARNRCLPLNVEEGVLLRERGNSLADIDPMALDKTVKFDKVGGLSQHIKAVKEMIFFPLMYPEVFQKFRIEPPRGVLFYGPPGTGKTLVARALANECSQGNNRVSFFMRKGADCLSKWVGESERQLRLLFEQAYTMKPSIIFFDEIDGLAPVRSTRQDQIHSSIVSTILALMDGLDSRGEIVVIGATNRVDAIDPALRRPGRFDREFYFPLPSLEDRKRILSIHTTFWDPPVSGSLLTDLSVKTVGFCGADLKSLCAESTLVALERCYPQIYNSSQKLLLDTTCLQVRWEDFKRALAKIVPAGHRAVMSPVRPLNLFMKPLLQRTLLKIIGALSFLFPVGLKHSSYELSVDNSSCTTVSSLLVDEDSIPDGLMDANMHFGCHRPRLLLSGRRDQGQTTHLAPSVLHCLEHLPVHRLELPSLYSVTCRSPEEACAQVFREALQKIPCVLYLPHVGTWWETVSDTVRVTLTTLLHDLNPNVPILFLATSDCPFASLPSQLRELFQGRHELLESTDPTDVDRRAFFANILKQVLIPPKSIRKTALRPLPLAPEPEPRKPTEEELERLRQKEESTLRELRLFLRDIVNKLARDKRFAIFNKPVDPKEVPDYLEVIACPMDLETIMSKIDLHQYEAVDHFLADIDLICHNALEYNPDRDPADKLIRHRACLFKDTAHAMIDNQLDEEFAKMCLDITCARKSRGEMPSKFAPTNYHVRKDGRENQEEQKTEKEGKSAECREPHMGKENEKRFSRRLLGMEQTKQCYRKKHRSPWFGSRSTRLVRMPLHNRAQKRQPPQPTDSETTELAEQGSETDKEQQKPPVSDPIEPQGSPKGGEEETDDGEGRNVVCVNVQKMASLEEKFVATTARFSVEMLEKLQATLHQCLIKHCCQWNKDLLLEEMESEVESFIRHIKRSL